MKLSTLALACLLFTLCIFVLQVSAAKGKGKPDCSVCEGILTRFDALVPADEKRNLAKVEKRLQRFCEEKNMTDQLQKKWCYYIDGVRRNIATKYVNGLPINAQCKKMNEVDSSICALRSPKKLSKDMDLKAMKVNELKNIIDDSGKQCKDCVEKGDFIKFIQTTLLAGMKDEM